MIAVTDRVVTVSDEAALQAFLNTASYGGIDNIFIVAKGNYYSVAARTGIITIP